MIIQIRTAVLTFLFDVVFLGIIVAITVLTTNGSKRLHVVGTICSAISVSMYASPMVVLVRKSIHFIFGLLIETLVMYVLGMGGLSSMRGRVYTQGAKNGQENTLKLHYLV